MKTRIIISANKGYLLKGHLRPRGYSNKFVEQQLQRVDGIKRDELLPDNAQRKKKWGKRR